MDKKLILDILEVLNRHGVIGGTVYRNEKIRQEYMNMRRNGIKGREARETLAETYFIDVKTVEAAIYRKKEKK